MNISTEDFNEIVKSFTEIIEDNVYLRIISEVGLVEFIVETVIKLLMDKNR